MMDTGYNRSWNMRKWKKEVVVDIEAQKRVREKVF